MKQRVLERGRSSSLVAAHALVLAQLMAVFGYLVFWLSTGRSESDLAFEIEWASFFVMPVVWLALFLAGLWFVRRPLPPRSKLAVKVGLLLTGICGVGAMGIASMFILSEIVFRLTDF